MGWPTEEQKVTSSATKKIQRPTLFNYFTSLLITKIFQPYRFFQIGNNENCFQNYKNQVTINNRCDVEDRLSEHSELNDSFGHYDKISYSTPIKLKERRYFSLIDVSNIDDDLQHNNHPKLTVSTDTIGSSSQSSVCKDSGYVHSESNTSLNSTKDQKRLAELMEDLKFKEVLITELEESNHSLRLKYAEAENRIAELRLKCETHCDCCNMKSTQIVSPNENDHVISRRIASECCLKEPSIFSAPSSIVSTVVSSTQNKEPSAVNAAISTTNDDDSFIKVKRWQERIGTLNAVSSDTTLQLATRSNVPTTNVNRSPIVQTRLIGDRSVRVSPLSNYSQISPRTAEFDSRQLPALNDSDNTLRNSKQNFTLMFENLQNFINCEENIPLIVDKNELNKKAILNNGNYELSSDDDNPTIEENERIFVEGTATNVSFKNESGTKTSRLRYIDRKLEMERTIRDGLNGIAEKGKLESSMRYRPWESSHINNRPFACKDALGIEYFVL